MLDRSFGVLGRMEVRCQGLPCKLPPGRQQAVLATLLIYADEVVSAPFLLDRIWGERADRSVLNVCMMRLRRSLQDPDHDVLRGEGDGYRLAVGADEVDLHRFRRLCREAAGVAERGDEERERDLLHEALALWRGEPFLGVDSAAIQSELVPILVEERLTATERRVDADLRYGLDRELVAELRELVGSHPFRELFWRQLMIALVRSGRQSDALDAYRSARDVFTSELGIEPCAELRQLQQRILNDDATLLDPAPGEQGPGTRAYVPLVPAQLPPLASGFTGRAAELSELSALSEPPGDGLRVVSIAGTPGVGKTTLALRWAADVGEKFPDGQLYVDLRGHSSRSPMEPLEAVVGFLRSLGVESEEIPADLEAASALYRSVTARRRVLVMLDNAARTNQVRPLLPGGDDCLVIVTSRDQLTGLVALDGAHELIVGTLHDAEATTLLATIVGQERIDADPSATGELVRACAHLPLALRVAGANIVRRQEHSVAEHVAGLKCGRILDALAINGEEQMAVRSVFASSYANLSESARTVFCLLGLFPGRRISAESLSVIAECTVEDASSALDKLRTAHLVQPYPDGRFGLHDLLRAYSTEVAARDLTEVSRHAAIRRLYEHYAHAVEQAACRLYPQAARLPVPSGKPYLEVSFTDTQSAMRWLEKEQANLVAAVTSADVNDEHLNGCRIGAALRGYLMMQVDWVRWLKIGRASLAAARSIANPQAEASARLSLANLHERRFEFVAAAAHYERALKLSRHAGWTHGEAAVHNNLAICLGDQGRLRPAIEHLRQAYELNRKSGWLAGQAMNLNNLGGIEMEMGMVTEALADLGKAHQLHRRVESRQGEAHSLSAMGEVHMMMGDNDRAKELLEKALAMQEALDDRTQLAFTLGYLADAHLRAGDHEQAVQLASWAVERDGTDASDGVAAALRVLGAVEHAEGRYERALAQYQRAIDIVRTNRCLTRTHVRALIDSARAYVKLDRYGLARDHIDRAIAMAKRGGFEAHVAEAGAVRADLVAQTSG